MEVSKNWKILPNLESSLPELLTAQCPSSLPSLHSVFFADCPFQVNFTVRLEIRHPIEVRHLQKLRGKFLLIKESLRNVVSWFCYLHTYWWKSSSDPSGLCGWHIFRLKWAVLHRSANFIRVHTSNSNPLTGSKCDPTLILGSTWRSGKCGPSQQSSIFSRLGTETPRLSVQVSSRNRTQYRKSVLRSLI